MEEDLKIKSDLGKEFCEGSMQLLEWIDNESKGNDGVIPSGGWKFCSHELKYMCSWKKNS